jgi:O-antigen/teichoic acid export membrane protein
LGKNLSTHDFGTFGLVAATVSIFIPLLGFRLDYIVSREIINCSEDVAARKMHDQLVIYCATYLIAIVCLFFLFKTALFQQIEISFFIIISLLIALETIGTIFCSNINSLGKPIAANLLLFVRSASWVFLIPFLPQGLAHTTILKNILYLWIFGAITSNVLVGLVLRKYPWQKVYKSKINKVWLTESFKMSYLIWIGSFSLAIANYCNRFVSEAFLNRELVGVVTLYTAIIIAVGSLLDSGLYAFARRRFVIKSSQEPMQDLLTDCKKTSLQAFIFAFCLCVFGGLIFKNLFLFFQKQEYYLNINLFYLLLVGCFISAGSFSFYLFLYAKHKDGLVFASDMMQMILSLCFNIAFVKIFGLIGVGISAILTSFIIFIFSIFCVYCYIAKLKK